MKRYPQEILDMLKPEGFDKRYHYHCRIAKTYQAAYELTELEFYDYYQMRRYASFNSFRVSHNKRLIGSILNNRNN
jgi:hypothetical protein